YVPGVTRELGDLVVRATRRDPGARPTDAGAFLAELTAVRRDLGLDAPAPARASARLIGHATVTLPRHEDDDYEPVQVHRAPRRRTGMVIAAMVVVLGLVAAFGGWWLGAGRYTDTPSLLTMSKQEAEATALRLGFEIDYDDGRYSEKVAKDIVLDQSPGPRERIIKGDVITLTLSLGKERYEVPDVVGDPLSEAKQELEKRKLQTKLKEQYSDSVPQGSVISVKPKPGTVVRPNTAVTVVVSKGEAPITVPKVVGEYVEDAEDELDGLGLVVKIKTEYSMDVERDRVIRQDPGPGTGVGDGATVTLTVSKGPPQVKVPDVIDKPLDDAKDILEKAGFEVKVYNFPGGDDVVYEQSPSGDTTADKGSTVSILVT
ncbi:MAG: PASTA domain-containing protein, partial [Micromonosporaceae bacterium]